MEGRQERRDRRGQHHQQRRAPLDQDAKHTQGRGLQELLPHPLPHAGRAPLLDSPQRGLPIQSDRYPLLPTYQEQHRHAAQQDTALLQPGVRYRPGGRHRA